MSTQRDPSQWKEMIIIMSIESLPQLTNFHTIFDWIRVFRNYPHFIPPETILKPVAGPELATLILLCIRQAAPFCVTMVQKGERLLLCQGCRELYSLYQFCSNQLPIKKEEWYFSIPFPSSIPICRYQDLSSYHQARLMSASVHSLYLSVVNDNDLRTLYNYYN